jgi:probable phosphoglycerate mutase
MTILLVRHGETPSNRDRIMQLADTPLSALGMRQAERLAERLSTRGVTGILCSDLLRARMTAAPLERLTGVAPLLTPLLRERDFGQLRGLSYDQLPCDPFAPDYVPPGGESWVAFHARISEAFALITETRRALGGDERNLVVITHGLVLHSLAEHHVHWPAANPELPARFGSREPRASTSAPGARPRAFLNTGVTEISAQPPHTAMLVNCCAHLRVDSAGGEGAPC